jgi:hypothetical protein
MKKKPFVIRCNPAPFGSKIPKYLKSLQSKRIVSTRWIDNARGFESREEAQALIEKISIELPRLDLSIESREESLIACDYCGSKVKKSEVKMTDVMDQVCIPCLIGRPAQTISLEDVVAFISKEVK